MTAKIDIALVGATGAVGEAMIDILEQRDFPVGTLYPLASARSAGKTIRFRGKSVTVQDLAEFDFAKVQIGLFFCWRRYFRNLRSGCGGCRLRGG